MFYLRIFLLAAFCIAATSASAGLFTDNEAHVQIQQAEARLAVLEESTTKLVATSKQQTSAMLDLQTAIESLNAEIKKLRGQNEELEHRLQDMQKSQKDIYVDLDGRLRRFEAADTALSDKVSGAKTKSEDTVTENRALEAAYGFYKAERYKNAVTAFQEFLKSFPKSVQTANVQYWMGNAYFILKDYKSSLASFQVLVKKFDSDPRVADVMLTIADCQESLNQNDAAKLTLKQIGIKFPNTDAAAKAKKELASLK